MNTGKGHGKEKEKKRKSLTHQAVHKGGYAGVWSKCTTDLKEGVGAMPEGIIVKALSGYYYVMPAGRQRGSFG